MLRWCYCAAVTTLNLHRPLAQWVAQQEQPSVRAHQVRKRSGHSSRRDPGSAIVTREPTQWPEERQMISNNGAQVRGGARDNHAFGGTNTSSLLMVTTVLHEHMGASGPTEQLSRAALLQPHKVTRPEHIGWGLRLSRLSKHATHPLVGGSKTTNNRCPAANPLRHQEIGHSPHCLV